MSHGKQPNILFILSDQHRGDWLGASGCCFVDTPNLDRMAKEGVRFSEAYCNSPLCVPSRMSMLTGRYPHDIGVYDNGCSLSSDIPTFAHAMGVAGYETVLCGRMHFVGPDQRHGYETRLVGDITPCYAGGPRGPLNPKTAGRDMESVLQAGPGKSPVMDYDEAVTESCERFLVERSRSRSRSEDRRPLFMTVGYYGPHHPFVCPPKLYEAAREKLDLYDRPLPIDAEPLHPWMQEWFRLTGSDTATEERIRAVRASYAGLIAKMDRLIGRILQAAESLEGPTYVIYASDHGEMAGDRSMFWKWSFYEGAVKVPMIWHELKGAGAAPGIRRESRVDVPVSLLDLAPTFATMAGALPLPYAEGKDLSPWILAGGQPLNEGEWLERPLFAELDTLESLAPARMVRWKQYKLIYYHGHEPAQMFDLKLDPEERQDLGLREDYAEVRGQLLRWVLQDWDPKVIRAKVERLKPDREYMTQWGKRVGYGPSDLWMTGQQYDRMKEQKL